MANESLEENFIILFGEGAPKDVAEYCYIHRNDIKEKGDSGNFAAGALMAIGEEQYHLTAAGDVARQNVYELVHITIRFDGAPVAEFPGTVHVAGKVPVAIRPGQKFRLLSK